MIIQILMLCVFQFYFFIPESTLICPLDQGEIIPYKGSLVHGEWEPKRLVIQGKEKSTVFSISDGKVIKIGMKTGIIYIESNSIIYSYLGVESRVRVGQKIEKGQSIGYLDIGGILSLEMKKEQKKLNPYNFINCTSISQPLKEKGVPLQKPTD